MSNEDLRLWKLQHERLKNWLKNAKSSASTMHQVPSIKQQIKDWEKHKPGSSQKSNTSNKSSLWRPLWAFPFKLIWRFTIGLLTDKL
jgi:hypothetical protein